MPGTDTMATATVAGDTEATTGLMATTERGLQMPSLSPQLLLSLMLMLIRGTVTDTVDMDGVDTIGLMATTATTEKGPQMPSLSPMLMLIRGTAMATVAMDGVATTGLMDTMATTE